MLIARYIVFISFILVLFIGCSKPNEGVIEYKITYNQTKEDNPLVNLMPKRMKFFYKDKFTLTQIEGWMGIFESCQLSDLEDSSNVFLVKLLDKKYFFRRTISEDPLAFETLDVANMKFENKDTVFKGYNCKQVLVDILKDSICMQYKFLYTNDIKILSPNRNNPFHEIPGVLLSFNMNFKGMAMDLEFISHRDTVFSKRTFKIPKEYKELSREDMVKFFYDLTSIN